MFSNIYQSKLVTSCSIINKYNDLYLGWDLEGLVVAAIFLCLLGHQTNIGHVTSGLPVKLAVGNTVLNDALQR